MPLLRSFALLLVAALALTACYGPNDVRSEPEKLMDKAAATARNMFADPEYPGLLNLANRSRGVLIIPSMFRGGFIWGGRGGNGVLLSRDESGNWSQPAFYTLGGVSWGLQAGLQDQEIIVVIMTERGLRAVANRRATLGADASVAAGELGKGWNAATGIDLNADMYAFAKSAGLYVGVALDGSWMQPRFSWNEQIYGAGTTPDSILFDRTSSNPAAEGLVGAMPR